MTQHLQNSLVNKLRRDHAVTEDTIAFVENLPAFELNELCRVVLELGFLVRKGDR